jgi:hypothetical protein
MAGGPTKHPSCQKLTKIGVQSKITISIKTKATMAKKKSSKSKVVKSSKSKGFQFKWWMGAIIIGIIAIVGIVVVNFSRAGTAAYWDLYCNQGSCSIAPFEGAIKQNLLVTSDYYGCRSGQGYRYHVGKWSACLH